MLKNPKHLGLVFDVDGVIADSEPVNVRATAKAFADILAIPSVTPEDFEKGIGRGAAAYVKAGAISHGRQLSEKQVKTVVNARQDNFLAILKNEPLPPFPGVIELITSALADEKFALAIATSGTRQKSQAVLDSAGIPYQKMAYICGDDITRKKPDPEVFQLACHRLNLPPQKCVVFEDAPNGIQAALAAGCKCIAITNTCPENILSTENPDLIVTALTEITLEKILSLFAGI
jgi:HAD superfamily hydrolase (TIGR01509 family)